MSTTRKLDALFYDKGGAVFNVQHSDFGAVGDGTIDDTSAIQSALNAARTQSNAPTADGTAGTVSSWEFSYVVFPEGRYKTTSTLTVPAGVIPIAAGRVAMHGDDSSKCFDFSSAVVGGARGFLFRDYTTAIEFDTNNASLARWHFEDITVFNCTTGIDSVSFADSRSTVLTIHNFRGAGTDRLVKSFTDVLHINGAAVWNKNDTPPFLIDSRALISNTLLVPKHANADAAWVEFQNSDVEGTRSLAFDNCRISGENGGIPAVLNKVDAESANRDVSGISFRDCHMVANGGGPSNNGGVVVLADDGSGGSSIPNFISFQRCVINSTTNGVAVTQSGNAPNNPNPIDPRIYLDEASLRHVTADDLTSSPVGETQLEAFLSRDTLKLYNDRVNEETLSGNKTLTVLDPGFQRLDPGGSNRNVLMPDEAAGEGLRFRITNTADNAENLVIQNSGGSTLFTLNQNEATWAVGDGSTWEHMGIETIAQS